MSDDPRLDPRFDSRLSDLISDSVSDVEPRDGLAAIRSRTRRPEEKSMNQRNWIYATGGAVVATAAVIVAIAVVAGLDNGPDPSPTGASSPAGQTDPTPSGGGTDGSPSTPTDSPSSSAPTPTGSEGAVAVYYVGDGPRGPVLFREFQKADDGNLPALKAASLAVGGTPLDPDYRTAWPAGTQASAVSYNGDVITVDLTGADLHDRPAGMSKREAALALQQVIYTVQGAVQARAGVQFLLDGQHSDAVLGEPASEPLANAKVLSTLSLMSITTPEEGQVVSGSFEASGVNNSFEASVSYEIRQGDKVVGSGFGMASGCCEDKLFPWTLTVDVSSLAPGTYTFVAMDDDPSGGEGHGPDVDTRTIVVQ